MIIRTTARFKPKKKRKPKGELATKYKAVVTKAAMKIQQAFVPRVDATKEIRSLVTTSAFVPARISMTDPMTLAKESPETQAAIIAKSKRIAIAFNKGAYQYVSDESDVKSIGRKNPV
jgi:hypothetical protein